ncbi:MAG: hypothetical protein MJZ51_03205 [Bacteroidales bacterium]|nr:hypothetical protein [Bacteroidales bacterium]
MKRKIILFAALLAVLAFSSCNKRCHCYGYDLSHTYYTKEDLKELGYSCKGMEQYMYGIVYSLCEYDTSDY